jgi:hypothetical protein
MKNSFYFLLLVLSCSLNAQIVNGFGIFASGTSSRHDYVNSNDPANFPKRILIPESHRSSERLSWGIGVMAELFNFFGCRWQSELEYINKGAKEKNELISIENDERRENTNKYKYIGFNNFIKYRFETINFTSSFLIGARAEYMLGKETPAYEPVSSQFKKLTFSPDIGLGFEPFTIGKLKYTAELHYNPDLLKQYDKDNLQVKNRTWELRLGIMLRNRESVDIDCNAPVYRGNY